MQEVEINKVKALYNKNAIGPKIYILLGWVLTLGWIKFNKARMKIDFFMINTPNLHFLIKLAF